MKSLSKIALVGLLFSSTTMAASSATVADLMYLTPVGSFLSVTDARMQTSSYTLEIGSNNETEFDSKNMIIEETFRFGVLDSLEIGARAGYVFGGSNEQKAQGSNATTTDFSGFSDPALLGRFRLFGQNDSFSNLDFVAEFSPGFANKEKGDTKNNGNAFRGGHAVEFGVEMGREVSTFSWKVGLAYEMLMKQTTEDANGIETQEVDSRGNIHGYAALQFFLMGVHSMDLFGGIVQNAEFKETTLATSKAVTVGSATDFYFGGGFNFSITKDFFISPYASYTFGGDRDVTSEVISNGKRTARKELDFGASVKFQF